MARRPLAATPSKTSGRCVIPPDVPPDNRQSRASYTSLSTPVRRPLPDALAERWSACHIPTCFRRAMVPWLARLSSQMIFEKLEHDGLNSRVRHQMMTGGKLVTEDVGLAAVVAVHFHAAVALQRPVPGEPGIVRRNQREHGLVSRCGQPIIVGPPGVTRPALDDARSTPARPTQFPPSISITHCLQQGQRVIDPLVGV